MAKKLESSRRPSGKRSVEIRLTPAELRSLDRARKARERDSRGRLPSRAKFALDATLAEIERLEKEHSTRSLMR